MGRADGVSEDVWPAVWETTVQSRVQEFIPPSKEEPWEVLGLNRVMGQMEGQWIPQTGLSICLSDPTEQGRISSLSHFLRTHYVLGSGWMLHVEYSM